MCSACDVLYDGEISMPKLSVVLPIYNGEKFLERCIGSILGQYFEDFELLCIDDGSDDKSNIIYEKYASSDKRVKIIKKQNGGVASARKVAIEYISGKYVTFIDQDDYIEKNIYIDTIGQMEQFEADMGVCGYYKDYGDKVDKIQNLIDVPNIITDINIRIIIG